MNGADRLQHDAQGRRFLKVAPTVIFVLKVTRGGGGISGCRRPACIREPFAGRWRCRVGRSIRPSGLACCRATPPRHDGAWGRPNRLSRASSSAASATDGSRRPRNLTVHWALVRLRQQSPRPSANVRWFAADETCRRSLTTQRHRRIRRPATAHQGGVQCTHASPVRPFSPSCAMCMKQCFVGLDHGW
jgi:hypothetical protein